MKRVRGGPPGLKDWEALFRRCLSCTGKVSTLVSVIQDAPGPVKELVEICEAHPWELYWTGDGVAIRETDKDKAAGYPAQMKRCVELIMDHQEEQVIWLANLLK